MYIWITRSVRAVAKVIILGADMVYYNANTRGKSVGDCVKRGLSLAYRMDYDEVASELNRIKREVGGDAYNNQRVYFKFFERRGDKLKATDDFISVSQFADTHPQGTWLVITAPTQERAKRQQSNHILPIINGTIYDSWNSANEFVVWYVEVRGGSGTDLHDDLDVKEIAAQVGEVVKAYAETLEAKHAEYGIHIAVSVDYPYDKFTYYRSYKVIYTDRGMDAWKFCKTVIKVSPAFDADKNIEVNIKRSKQKLYDTVYEVVRSIKANAIKTNGSFYGDRKLLLSLPEAIRPYVKHAELYYDSYEQNYRYEVAIRPMPGDPDNYNYYIEAYSMKDVKQACIHYLEDFTRDSW